MKRFSILAILAIAISAAAQTPTYTSPQSVTQAAVFNGVTTAQTSGSLTNVGQTIHFLSYQISGATVQVQIRLEGSYNNSFFFPISDDAIDQVSGVVVGIGTYPFVRANLVVCNNCGAGLTANYTGTSSVSGVPYGFYNPSQQVRKVMFMNQAANAGHISSSVVAPYGSAAGVLVLVAGGGGFPSGSSMALTTFIAEGTGTSATVWTLGTQANTIAIPMPAWAASTLSLTYSSGGASANSFSAYYFFSPPGSAQPAPAQPALTSNLESTAGTNTAVSINISANTGMFGTRAHLFFVNARCSAGTAQLLVKDAATTIYSTGATEVGTTSFSKSWNPGLAGSPGNNMLVQLGTCGVGNTGTLDVQGSVF